MSDPVTVSVLTHRLEAIVQEMGEAMLRTAYSQILNSSRDFSTALCDAGARLIARTCTPAPSSVSTNWPPTYPEAPVTSTDPSMV